ncbi:uncharacterized protein LOC143299864 [Babylonia areolata]|uniref:uncharacterized protein LOC143299864 n=1 Tax=Babylonia areolata TaxID=304850 RepID=UPI003FD2A9D1
MILLAAHVGLFQRTKGQDLWKRKTFPITIPAHIRLSKFQEHPAADGPEPPALTQTPSTPGTASPGRDNPVTPAGCLTRRSSSQSFKRLVKNASNVSAFLATEGSAVSAQNSARSEGEVELRNGGGSGRSTRKFLYSLAAVSMENRRSSGGFQWRGGSRRESGSSAHSRLVGLAGSVRRNSAATEQRASTLGGINKLATLASLMGLKQRAQERLRGAKSKAMWRKLRIWGRVVGVLSRLLRQLSASAMTDPSSPFYSSQATDTSSMPLEDLLGEAVDKDDDMLFDPSRFKANRQRRVPQEAKRILTKPAAERTPEEIQYAMIGMRNIPQVAIFPMRMQRNLAQFGEFQCFEAKRRILRQGHPADGFYVILYGNVIVAVKNEETGFAKIVVELPRGETFGDIAIVSGGARNSSVLTKTYTELLYISKSVYENTFLTGGMKSINDPDHHDFLGSLSFLRGWPIQKLSDKESEKFVRFMYIQRDGVIMRDSNFTNWLVVVKSGSLKVLKKLVRSKPTVSRRSGLYRHRSCASAYESFVMDAREYNRWLTSRGVSLPSPLQADDGEEEEEEEEFEEEEEVEDQKEEEDEFDDDVIGDVSTEDVDERCENEQSQQHPRNNDHHDEQHHNQHHPHINEHQGHHHHHHHHQQDHQQDHQHSHKRPRERRKGVIYPGHDGVRSVSAHPGVRTHPVRPHTWVKGDLQDRHPSRSRKSWSAKHPAPSPALTSALSNRGAHLPKRTKLTSPKIRFDVRQSPQDTEQDIPQEAKFALAKRTILDDMDAAYLSKTHPVTEADMNPQFVYVQTLTKGDVFGLASLVFPDQPSLCLVSNGAECMFIDKRFYQDHCPPLLSRRLRTEVSPYPSDSKLQQDLVNRINWDVYKQVVKRQVHEQSPLRVTVRPL